MTMFVTTAATAHLRRLLPREILGDTLPETIRFLEEAAPADESDDPAGESPIFLLSAGWRSGSTLLQRLLCSGNETLLWGEPYGDRVPVCRLAATLEGLREGDAHLKYTIDGFRGELSKEWVANLNPGVSPLRNAHRAYFDTLFAETAREAGYCQWGAKWVRVSGFHAWYLKWMYPKARIIFLVRNPLDAYHSYKRKKWYTVRPVHRVSTASEFMAHWSYLAQSFLTCREDLGALLVRYEDIQEDGPVLSELESYIGHPVAREILSHKIGSSRPEVRRRLWWWDRQTCQRLTGEVCSALGYSL